MLQAQVGRLWEVLACCGDCRKDHERQWRCTVRPCGYCARPVGWYDDQARRRRTLYYCCNRCRGRAYNQLQKARRSAARHLTCATCKTTFTPARADGRYCSPACRQRAYRQRRASEDVA
jgi:hypothetical protein